MENNLRNPAEPVHSLMSMQENMMTNNDYGTRLTTGPDEKRRNSAG